jgi:hypothetical protein
MVVARHLQLASALFTQDLLFLSWRGWGWSSCSFGGLEGGGGDLYAQGHCSASPTPGEKLVLEAMTSEYSR